MQDFQIITLHKCIVMFDFEQVWLKLHATNFKNKDVPTHPKAQTLRFLQRSAEQRGNYCDNLQKATAWQIVYPAQSHERA